MLSQQAQDFRRSVPDPYPFVKAGSGNETKRGHAIPHQGRFNNKRGKEGRQYKSGLLNI